MTVRRFLPLLVAGIVVILIVWNTASFLDPLLPPWGGHFLTHLAIWLSGAVIGVGALRSRVAGGSVPHRAAELGVIAGGILALPVAAWRLPFWLLALMLLAAALYLVVGVLGLGPIR